MFYLNKPYLAGKEIEYIQEALIKKTSGNGVFTKKCHEFFQQKYGFKKVLLTTSCTDALEMAALLIDIQAGDEVIIPSFTFVSTANAFVLRGAKIVFADSSYSQPNVDADQIEKLISPRTKAIVVVHYAGVSCDMDKIMELINKYNLYLIEDTAQAVDAYHNNKPLGSFGHLSCFSFHETKNISSGEGGLLVINEESLFKRAEIIWEKGTNRAAFFRGEVDKYNWVDIGSSFLPSEIIAAFLFAQLEKMDEIQSIRRNLWAYYHKKLKKLEEGGLIQLPVVPSYAKDNAHIFYGVCRNFEERNALIDHLKTKQIQALFHYLSLHKSPYFTKENQSVSLPYAERFEECLIRIPLFPDLTFDDIDYIVGEIYSFYGMPVS